MTVSIPAHDILIKFRFTGHHRVKKFFHGISSFTEPLWLADYRYTVIVNVFQAAGLGMYRHCQTSAAMHGEE